MSLPEELVEAIQARAATERRKFSPMLALLAEAGLASSNGSKPVVSPVGGKEAVRRDCAA